MAQPTEAGGMTGALDALIERSGALTALLITRQGALVTSAGATGFMNITALAALVAGMFSATREVARLVGERRFSILLQQGETRHIHISLIGEDMILVVVFEDVRRIGLVRFEARRAAERIVTAQAELAPEAAHAELSVPKFKEFALNLIDKIFEAE